MSKGINKNKVAISERQKVSDVIDPGFNVGPFDLPRDVKEELEAKGLVGRFINVKEMERFGGVHPKGWRPYKRTSVENSEYAAIFGKDPDGYIRRGDVILGVKTKEEVARHKAYLAQRAAEQDIKKVTKKSGQVLREYVKDLGLSDNVSVTESDWDE